MGQKQCNRDSGRHASAAAATAAAMATGARVGVIASCCGPVPTPHLCFGFLSSLFGSASVQLWSEHWAGLRMCDAVAVTAMAMAAAAATLADACT